MLDLFSGIGGFSLAASWTGQIETVAFCEIDKYCQKVLQKNFPGIPIIENIKDLKNEKQYGAIDIITGGFPCQPFSVAGKQRGKEDDRYLWPEMFRIIQEFRPTWVIGENVTGFVNLGLEQAILDLESEGYEVQTFNIPACAKDAPHQRKRIWIIAHSSTQRLSFATREKLSGFREKEEKLTWCESCRIPAKKRGVLRDTNELDDDKPGYGASKIPKFKTSVISKMPTWQSESGICRVANGVSNRTHRLKGLGNAIVPQVAFEILNSICNVA